MVRIRHYKLLYVLLTAIISVLSFSCGPDHAELSLKQDAVVQTQEIRRVAEAFQLRSHFCGYNSELESEYCLDAAEFRLRLSPGVEYVSQTAELITDLADSLFGGSEFRDPSVRTCSDGSKVLGFYLSGETSGDTNSEILIEIINGLAVKLIFDVQLTAVNPNAAITFLQVQSAVTADLCEEVPSNASTIQFQIR